MAKHMGDEFLSGVSLIQFVNAMHEIDTTSVAAFKAHEIDAYFGMVYGMIKAGITDHRISDAATMAICAVRNDPLAYMGKDEQEAVAAFLKRRAS